MVGNATRGGSAKAPQGPAIAYLRESSLRFDHAISNRFGFDARRIMLNSCKVIEVGVSDEVDRGSFGPVLDSGGTC